MFPQIKTLKSHWRQPSNTMGVFLESRRTYGRPYSVLKMNQPPYPISFHGKDCFCTAGLMPAKERVVSFIPGGIQNECDRMWRASRGGRPVIWARRSGEGRG